MAASPAHAPSEHDTASAGGAARRAAARVRLHAVDRDGPGVAFLEQRDGGLFLVRVLPAALHTPRAAVALRRLEPLVQELAHPAIVPVAVEFDPRETRLVSPALYGVTLRERLARCGGRLAPLEVAQVVLETAAVLDAMHSARQPVLHRRLSPATIFLTEPRQRVRLLDAGLGHVLHVLGVAPRDGARPAAAYLSPEDARGAPRLERASEQFALASIAFEALTGRAAFAGSVDAAVRAMRGPARPSVVDPSREGELPGALDAVLHRAWSVEPRARFADATTFAIELFAVLVADARERAAPLEAPEPLSDLDAVDAPPAPEPRVRVVWAGSLPPPPPRAPRDSAGAHERAEGDGASAPSAVARPMPIESALLGSKVTTLRPFARALEDPHALGETPAAHDEIELLPADEAPEVALEGAGDGAADAGAWPVAVDAAAALAAGDAAPLQAAPSAASVPLSAGLVAIDVDLFGDGDEEEDDAGTGAAEGGTHVDADDELSLREAQDAILGRRRGGRRAVIVGAALGAVALVALLVGAAQRVAFELSVPSALPAATAATSEPARRDAPAPSSGSVAAPTSPAGPPAPAPHADQAATSHAVSAPAPAPPATTVAVAAPPSAAPAPAAAPPPPAPTAPAPVRGEVLLAARQFMARVRQCEDHFGHYHMLTPVTSITFRGDTGVAIEATFARPGNLDDRPDLRCVYGSLPRVRISPFAQPRATVRLRAR